jgi:deoxyribose-phosphate aldolase
MRDVLGEEWLEPHLFRIGASSLLADIVSQLDAS